MKKSEDLAKKVTISIPADLFAWGEQERTKRDVTRSEFVATLYRQSRDDCIARERLARYAAAYAKQPMTDEERHWAESAADSLATLYGDE